MSRPEIIPKPAHLNSISVALKDTGSFSRLFDYHGALSMALRIGMAPWAQRRLQVQSINSVQSSRSNAVMLIVRATRDTSNGRSRLAQQFPGIQRTPLPALRRDYDYRTRHHGVKAVCGVDREPKCACPVLAESRRLCPKPCSFAERYEFGPRESLIRRMEVDIDQSCNC